MKVFESPEQEQQYLASQAARKQAKSDEEAEVAEKRTMTDYMVGFYSILMGLFIVGALFSLYAGFRTAENAITQIDYLALAAVLGIFARIAQAAKHHTVMMEER